ncbi:hypothetical protein BGX27_003839 [Mortierella sp. AM989]|nr:hypothetical protein BGX27_003839 [Mortierella sp. AM989]
MVRFEKNEGRINIAWGHDEALGGYFLTVEDERLSWSKEASSDVNRICEKVAADGGGSYFDMNSYQLGGFGHKVSEATIFTFMRRYGIDPTKILPNQDKPAMVMNPGGETPQLRIDPTYILERRARIQNQIENSKGKATTILVARVDRTVTELSKQLNVPILRGGLVPPMHLTYTIIFFPQGAYPEGFQECTHPDCRFPEMDDVKYLRCSSCKQVTYCSKVCQKADWKRHKISCQQSRNDSTT